MTRWPKPLHQELRVVAAEEGLSMAAWLERLAFPIVEQRAKQRQKRAHAEATG
jgi:hypothetical protein